MRMRSTMKIAEILEVMNVKYETLEIEPFLREEDGTEYEVWKLKINNQYFVLKKAKQHELAVYTCFLSKIKKHVPYLYQTAKYEGIDYLLIECLNGYAMIKCNRESLIKAVDALISIQKVFWKTDEPVNFAYSFEKTLESRINRGKYLNDFEIEQAYSKYLEYYQIIPRTLCHDDLLPFNVLVDEDKAALIDWEFAGIMPYLTSFARLIAHGEEQDEELFYIKDEDKTFIIDYYYDNFVKLQGISYDEYSLTLKYFILYEYTEWIMLGVKHHNTESKRYLKYYEKAKKLILELNKK